MNNISRISRGLNRAIIQRIAIDTSRSRRALLNWGRMIGSTAGVGPALITSLSPWVVEVSDTAGTFGTPTVVFDGTESAASFDLPFTPEVLAVKKLITIEVGQSARTWYLRFSASWWDGTAHTYANAAEAVAAGDYITIGFEIDDTNYDSYMFDTLFPEIPVGSILWVEATNSNPGIAGAERQISFLAFVAGFPN